MNLLAPDWYRVSYLRPRLRAGLRVSRQMVRGEPWQVVADPLGSGYLRFNRLAWQLVAGCDGTRTLDDVWSAVVESAGDDAPTQSEAIEIISRAFAGHLLVGDIPPDAAAVVQVQARARQRKRRAAVNPLAFRLSLWDPDAFLTRHCPRVAVLFSPIALRVTAVLIALSLAMLVIEGSAIAHDVKRMVAEPRGLMLMWLAYPLIKAVHELAHAFAVKHHGGEVHQLGVTLLMLTPVPFVDASASVAFSNKWERARVAGAGIVVELLMAGAALVAWNLLEPGLARECATAVVVVGGLSTLLINGNPLFRFDGYHVLCDVAELPNLAQRSTTLWLQMLRRRLLGLKEGRVGSWARGERPWLIAYAPLSWLLRSLMLGLLAASLAHAWPWLAIALAFVVLWISVGGPLWKALRWTLLSPWTASRRPRAVLVVITGIGAALLVGFVLPLPQRSFAPGIVALPDEAQVRLDVGGFVDAFLARDGDVVNAGAPLVQLSNPQLLSDLARARSELGQADVLQAQLRDSDPLKAAQARDRVLQLRAEVQALQSQYDALQVRATSGGRVAFDVHRDRVGMFMPQGHLIAQVVPDAAPLVRAVVDNSDIALVRARTEGARVELAGGGNALAARVKSALPQATTALPSAALGTAGGGVIAINELDSSGRTAREPRFRVDLSLSTEQRPPIGARVLVTFDHGSASGAEWLMRMFRRAFLRHLSI